jgi:microsomal dipeptidase-like Zn-dependent dipeptidase
MSTHFICDLHVHCGLKGYAAEDDPQFAEHTIWDYYPPRERELNELNFVLRGAIKETAKSSQANLDACAQASLCIPFLAIYPIERQMFALDPQKPFRWLFKILLAGKQHAYLGAAVAGFPIERVEKILANVANERDEGVNYYNQFRKERDYLLRQTAHRSKKYPDFRYCIAADYLEFRTSLRARDTICGLFTVEGAHSFGNYLHNSTFQKNYEDLYEEERRVLRDSFLNNLTEVKTEENGRYAPLFVTFCHHFNNLLAGHARSFSDKSGLFLGLNKPGMRHLFNQEPGLNLGFSELGAEVRDLLLDRERGRRILIDTKHMSVQSRKEFYAYIRDKREKENDPVPIIHSHAAVSGWLTLDQAEQNDDSDSRNEQYYFSRWSINLTNEDILETYDSDGLIGVVLHEGRMPGSEFKKKARKLKKRLKKAKAGSPEYAAYNQELKDMYLQLLWSNIFHIVKVIRDNRHEDGWKLIALGSDYDGLVDPFNSFPHVDSFQDLRQDMIGYLEREEEVCFSEGGTARPIPAAEVKKLMGDRTAEELVTAVMFSNTEHFLSKYFTRAYLGVDTENKMGPQDSRQPVA